MARQGCLCLSSVLARLMLLDVRSRCALVVIVSLNVSWGQAPSQADPAKTQVDTKLQLVWSAPNPKQWNIVLRLSPDSDGQFSELENYCNAETSTGAFRASPDGRTIRFVPRIAQLDGEFRIRYRGSRTAEVSISVETSPKPLSESTRPETAKSTTIAELIGGASIGSDPGSNDPKWSMRRLREDPIQIRFPKDLPYCQPGQAISFSARANSIKHDATDDLELIYELHRVSDRKVVSQKTFPIALDAFGNSKPIEVNDARPDQPGVYEVRCRVGAPEKIWSRLRRSHTTIAQSAKPLVVIPGEISQRGPINWKKVGVIQPAERPGWELKQWLPSNGRSLTESISSNGPGLEQAKHNDEPVSILDSSGTYATALPKLQAGAAHRISLRYPAGQDLRVQLEFSTSDQFDRETTKLTITDSSTLSDKQPWRSQSVLYFPHSSFEYVRLTNLSKSELVSFAEIQVSSAEGLFPLERLSDGIEPTEKTRTAVLSLKDLNWVNQITTDLNSKYRDTEFDLATIAMHRLVTATNRMTALARISGYNAVSLPINDGGRTWYRSDNFAPLRKLDPQSALSMQTVLQLIAPTGLRAMVDFTPSMMLTQSEQAIAQSRSKATSILRHGGLNLRPHHYQLVDENVQNHLAKCLQEIENQLIDQPAYDGIVLSCISNAHSAPSRSTQIGDESMLRKFATDIGQPNANASINVLSDWCKTEGKEPLARWCLIQNRGAYERLASGLRAKLVLTHCDEVPSNASIGLLVARSQSSPVATNPQPAEATQIEFAPNNNQVCTAETAVQRLTRALATDDPEILLIANEGPSMQWSPEFAEALRGFTLLPATKLLPVTGDDPAVETTLVRYGLRDGKCVVAVLNNAPWTSEVEIPCSESIEVHEIRDSKTKFSDWSSENNTIRARLAPGRTLVLKSDNAVVGGNPILSWSTRVSGGQKALSDIKEQVTTVVERIGSLSELANQVALKNSGFEQPAGLGIPGWMHTQHPSGAVRIDTREAAKGKQSILLTTDPQHNGRTWIVSEQFKPSNSGRLAVSLACRAELAEVGSTTHKLRISVEGTQNAEPVRQSREFSVPRDGQWQSREVVLEVVGIDPTSVESIRLTIDSLSAGRVWVDDIQLHDWFAVATERRDLQNQAFKAVQGLQRGNLTPAATLLQNDWAQHLLSRKIAVKAKPAAVPAAPVVPKRKEPPSVAERIKGWLPRPLRF